MLFDADYIHLIAWTHHSYANSFAGDYGYHVIFFHMQNPCCSSKNQAQDEFTLDSLPLSTSGIFLHRMSTLVIPLTAFVYPSPSNKKGIYVGSEKCSAGNQSQLMKNYSGEEPCVKPAMPSFNRQGQKRKSVNDKVHICHSILYLVIFVCMGVQCLNAVKKMPPEYNSNGNTTC